MFLASKMGIFPKSVGRTRSWIMIEAPGFNAGTRFFRMWIQYLSLQLCRIQRK